MTERRGLVDAAERMSVRNQCELLGISRSGLYHQCQPETPENLKIMRRLDELHLRHPVYGSRRLTWLLEREGLRVNRKRVMRLSNVPESTKRCRFEIHGFAGSLQTFSSKRSSSIVSVPPQRGGAYQPRVQPWVDD